MHPQFNLPLPEPQITTGISTSPNSRGGAMGRKSEWKHSTFYSFIHSFLCKFFKTMTMWLYSKFASGSRTQNMLKEAAFMLTKAHLQKPKII